MNKIYLYKVTSLRDSESELLGKDVKSRTLVLEYLSWAATELVRPVDSINLLSKHKIPNLKNLRDQSILEVENYVRTLEKRLINHTYLADQGITIADLFVASCFYPCCNYIFGKIWRNKHFIFMRWFDLVTKNKILSYFFDNVYFPDKSDIEIINFKKKQRLRHPLHLLPKPKIRSSFLFGLIRLPIRVSERRVKTAFDWFWSYFDDDEYSIWKFEYKSIENFSKEYIHNGITDERDFSRLMASSKYMTGKIYFFDSYYSLEKKFDSYIIGTFIIRGQNYVPIFNVLPGWKDYKYTKLDSEDEEDKKFIQQFWGFRYTYKNQHWSSIDNF